MSNVLESAVEYYGKYSRIDLTFEEMAELTKELSKNCRGADNIDGIAEEIADVQIMLDQLKIVFNCSREVDLWRGYKIERLRQNLTKAGVRL